MPSRMPASVVMEGAEEVGTDCSSVLLHTPLPGAKLLPQESGSPNFENTDELKYTSHENT